MRRVRGACRSDCARVRGVGVTEPDLVPDLAAFVEASEELFEELRAATLTLRN